MDRLRWLFKACKAYGVRSGVLVPSCCLKGKKAWVMQAAKEGRIKPNPLPLGQKVCCTAMLACSTHGAMRSLTNVLNGEPALIVVFGLSAEKNMRSKSLRGVHRIESLRYNIVAHRRFLEGLKAGGVELPEPLTLREKKKVRERERERKGPEPPKPSPVPARRTHTHQGRNGCPSKGRTSMPRGHHAPQRIVPTNHPGDASGARVRHTGASRHPSTNGQGNPREATRRHGTESRSHSHS